MDFCFPQSKQNITEDKGFLKFGVISPGKPVNYLTGLESHFFLKKALDFLFQEKNLILALP